MRSFSLSILFIFFMSACSNKNVEVIAEYCYSFDERQCGVDPYASLGLSTQERKSKIEAYLNSLEIKFDELQIIDPFYEFNCDACEICPEDHKYFIKISSQDTAAVNSLNLFNLKEENCNEVF